MTILSQIPLCKWAKGLFTVRAPPDLASLTIDEGLLPRCWRLIQPPVWCMQSDM